MPAGAENPSRERSLFSQLSMTKPRAAAAVAAVAALQSPTTTTTHRTHRAGGPVPVTCSGRSEPVTWLTMGRAGP